jgi:hypothetical protein
MGIELRRSHGLCLGRVSNFKAALGIRSASHELNDERRRTTAFAVVLAGAPVRTAPGLKRVSKNRPIKYSSH